MKNRTTSDNSSEVSLFPFLAVLLCTMGALLVLLVILAQQAGRKSIVVSAPAKQSVPVRSTEPKNAEQAADLARQLDEVHKYQQQLQQLREQAERRVRNEQLRLSHLEEHSRRLEHELARLSIAAQQLEATEKNQTVDQQQAQRDLAKLHGLIQETKERLEEMSKQASEKRSYAIVPYKGPNGTYRKPIYIECTKEGVIIHPEGIVLSRNDFLAPSWPGNPLAAALRASREYLNAKAAKEGQPDPPDPYPLLLVRPDGIAQYGVARAAIASWDADFGYEFIDSDWKLDFPELADPQLARVQQHAILQAREMFVRLARAAPSRYRGLGIGSGRGATGGTAGPGGYGEGGQSGDSDRYGELAQAEAAGSGNGNGRSGSGQADSAGADSGGLDGAASGDFQYGALQGDPSENGLASGATGANAGEAANEPINSQAGEEGAFNRDAHLPTGTGTGANRYAQTGTPSGTTAAEGAASAGGSSGGAASGASSGNSNAASGSTASGQSARPSNAGSAGSSLASAQVASIAESQGRNWAVERGTRRSIPVRRPIHVVVRKNQLVLPPGRNTGQGVETSGVVISLDQSVNQISRQFVAALRDRLDEWGLAGNGLYWKPVLVLNVGPEAEHTASQITRLLKNSGVEVRLPETAQTGQGARVDAPR